MTVMTITTMIIAVMLLTLLVSAMMATTERMIAMTEVFVVMMRMPMIEMSDHAKVFNGKERRP